MADYNLGTAYVQIMPSTRGLSGNISKTLNGEADGAAEGFGGKFLGKLKGMIAAAGIGATVGKAISEGAALEQSLGGVETLYGKHADTVIANADRAWKTAGVSANEYMEQSTTFAAALLNSLNGDTAAAAKYADMAITDMADNSAKFGTDLQSLQAAYSGFSRQNYTMLDNLKLGYGGTKSEMERLLKDAEKLSGQKFDINNLADVYQAIHLVEEDLGVTGTTAKEAAATLSGSFAAMKSAATNFLGDLTLGREVGPAMGDLIESTSTFLFDNLIPAVGRVFASLPGAMGTFLQDGFPRLSASLQTMLHQLAGSLAGSGDFIGRAMSGLLDFSKVLLDQSGPLIRGGLSILENLAQGIADGLPAFIAKAPLIVSNLADIINRNAPKVITSGLKIMKTLAVGLIKAIPALVKAIPSIFVAVVKTWSAMNWLNLGKGAIKAIKNGFTSGVSGIIGLIRGLINKIRSFFPLSVGRIFTNLKLPDIQVSGGKAPWGIGGKGVKPSFDVHWNAAGGIFDSASIIGYGVGEAGAEAILPLDSFYQHLDQKLDSISGGGAVTMIINLDGETIARNTIDYVNGQTLTFGTSPLAL